MKVASTLVKHSLSHEARCDHEKGETDQSDARRLV